MYKPINRTFRFTDADYKPALSKAREDGRSLTHVIRKFFRAYSKSKTNSFKVEL